MFIKDLNLTVGLINKVRKCIKISKLSRKYQHWRLILNPDLIFEQANVVVRGLRVEFSFSLQVELQCLHVKPEVSGVWVTLRWITAQTQRRDILGAHTVNNTDWIKNTEGSRPVEQLLIWQEVIDPRDVDQPEAEHGDVGVGCENPSDACREGHRQVSCDLHQTSGGRQKHKCWVEKKSCSSFLFSVICFSEEASCWPVVLSAFEVGVDIFCYGCCYRPGLLCAEGDGTWSSWQVHCGEQMYEVMLFIQGVFTIWNYHQ